MPWTNNSPVRLLKLHGSVDWKYVPNGERRWFPGDLERLDGDLYRYKNLASANERRCVGGSAFDRPYIVLPSFAKLQWIERLREAWREVVTHFSNAEAISIIGFSLRRDDYHTRAIMIPGIESFQFQNDRKIQIIDPDRRVLINYGFVPIARINYLEAPFDAASLEWLGSIFRG